MKCASNHRDHPQHSDGGRIIVTSILSMASRPEQSIKNLQSYQRHLESFAELPELIAATGSLMGLRGFEGVKVLLCLHLGLISRCLVIPCRALTMISAISWHYQVTPPWTSQYNLHRYATLSIQQQFISYSTSIFRIIGLWMLLLAFEIGCRNSRNRCKKCKA